MLKVDRKRGLCFALVFCSLAWGYIPEWLPYAIAPFQSELKVIGHISKFREDCKEPQRAESYCSDQYRISRDLLPENVANKSIGLGFIASEVIVGCANGNVMGAQKIQLGNPDFPFRKNSFSEFRDVNLDLLDCPQGLIVQAWVRYRDVRHGLIGGPAIVGETASINEVKKCLEYFLGGFLIVLSILIVPLVFMLNWCRKNLRFRGPNEQFIATSVYWFITLVLVSGLVQNLLPLSVLQIPIRKLTNVFNVLAQLALINFYFTVSHPSLRITRILQYLYRPIIPSLKGSVWITPALIFGLGLLLSKDWAYGRVYSCLVIGIASVILFRKSPSMLCLALFGLAGEFKIMNVIWAPLNATNLVLFTIIFMAELGILMREEVTNTLYNFLNNTTSDNKLSAQLAHDIRSPLAVLKLLIDQVEWKADQSQVKETVIGSIDRISKISSSCLQSHNKSFLLCSGTKPIRDAITEVLVASPKVVNLSQSIDDSCHFQLNELTVYRIAQNVIRNAFESPNVSTVEIYVKKVGSGKSLFHVRNDGYMPPASAFEKIVESGGTYGKPNGHGIGVHFCRTEIERSGGDFKMFIEQGKMNVEIVI